MSKRKDVQRAWEAVEVWRGPFVFSAGAARFTQEKLMGPTYELGRIAGIREAATMAQSRYLIGGNSREQTKITAGDLRAYARKLKRRLEARR